MNDVKTSAMSRESAGNFFEDFKLGQEIVHATPRTVTVGDTSLFTALYGSRFAVQSSDAFAQAIGYPTASTRMRPATSPSSASSVSPTRST